MALYADRRRAGTDLARALAAWRGTDAVVCGIARGGVVVAAAVADVLGLPLTAVAVRKLGTPGREEVALGAIAPDVRVVDERMLRRTGTTDRQLSRIEARERDELARRLALTGAPDVAGRPVLLVDDGIATGASARAAARALHAAAAATVVLAVPVAPASWRPEPGVADAYVCAHPVDDFWAVGACYDDFRQTGDDEVARLLRGDR